jgi:hypothetical protein
MKTKISTILLPVIIGIIAVLGLLYIFNLIFFNRVEILSGDLKFFTLFVPVVFVCASIIQYLLTNRFRAKFNNGKRVLGLNLYQFICLISIIGGLLFGFIFWERSYGIKELILVSATGFVSFLIYWSSNIFVLNRLERR